MKTYTEDQLEANIAVCSARLRDHRAELVQDIASMEYELTQSRRQLSDFERDVRAGKFGNLEGYLECEQIDMLCECAPVEPSTLIDECDCCGLMQAVCGCPE